MQADTYAGFNQLYDAGRVQEPAGWAHVRDRCWASLIVCAEDGLVSVIQEYLNPW